MSLGEKVDLDCYGRLAGHVRRILETIGVQRVAKPINNGANVRRDYFAQPVPKATDD